MNKSIDTNILDEILDEALPVYVKAKTEQPDVDIKFSEEHEENMRKIFDGVKRKEKFYYATKVVGKVAAVFVVAGVILCMAQPSNSAWKKKIAQFFVREEGTGYSWVVYDDSGDEYKLNFETSKNEIRNCKITFLDYLPAEYTLTVNMNNEKTKYFKLSNNEKTISVKISKEVNMKALDTEATSYLNAVISNIDMNYFSKDNICSYTWYKDNYLFRFYGENVENSEIVKVIENINYEEIEKIF